MWHRRLGGGITGFGACAAPNREMLYRTELWTLPRIAEVIERRFGVRYDASNVWHILRRMNWSCQKPERRARERDEARIARWHKQDWWRIKRNAKVKAIKTGV